MVGNIGEYCCHRFARVGAFETSDFETLTRINRRLVDGTF